MTNTTETLVPQVADAPSPVTEEVVKTTPVETPPVETKEEPKPEEDPKFAARFAALSRKERDLIQREKAAKQAQQEYQAFQQQLANAKKDPIAYLQAAGFTLEQAISQVLKEGEEPTPEQLVKQDVDAIKAEIEAYKKAQAEAYQKAQQAKAEQEEAQILSGIKSFVESNSEKYELINAYNAIPDVWEVIKRTYVETQGKVHLTEEQAAQAVEEQLELEAKQEAERLKKAKKLQSLFGVNQEVSTPKEVRTVSPTLTNQTATTSAGSPKRLTREESIAQAARLLKWNEK